MIFKMYTNVGSIWPAAPVSQSLFESAQPTSYGYLQFLQGLMGDSSMNIGKVPNPISEISLKRSYRICCECSGGALRTPYLLGTRKWL